MVFKFLFRGVPPERQLSVAIDVSILRYRCFHRAVDHPSWILALNFPEWRIAQLLDLLDLAVEISCGGHRGRLSVILQAYG